jgi:hypothetical protein
MKLPAHLYLVPKSNTRGAIPPLPNTSSWRGAQLKKKKHRDNFTFNINEQSQRRMQNCKECIWKGKVILSLSLIKPRAMKAYGDNEGIAPRILNPDTRCEWVISFKLRPLYSGGKSPPVHIGLKARWGPKVGLNAVGRESKCRKAETGWTFPRLDSMINWCHDVHVIVST